MRRDDIGRQLPVVAPLRMLDPAAELGADAGRTALRDQGVWRAPAPLPPDVRRPFPSARVVLRLRGRMRRSRRAGGEILRFGDLVLDTWTREVRRRGRPIQLTPTEFGLLELFLRHPRGVLPRSYIQTHVWGFDHGVMSNSLNVYVAYVRRKIEAAGEPRLIHTVRGVGYVLREP